MAQRNVKLDEFEALKETIHKRDLEILGLFSEQIEIFAGAHFGEGAQLKRWMPHSD